MTAGASPSPPLLVATVHDVAPRWLPEVQALRRALAAWGADRVTLLVVPHFHHGVRTVEHAATMRWLVERRRAGDELALHGYHHVQHGAPRHLVDRVRARLWTAGEGECLRPATSLATLLTRGRDELGELLPAAPGFVAPAWLEPRGLPALLARHGFAWHETSRFVEALPSRRRIEAPVIGFATRTPLRETLSLAWARALLTVAGPSRPASLRLALHPADLSSPRVMGAVERVVRTAIATRQAATTTACLAAAAT
jgi:hypothetical protein